MAMDGKAIVAMLTRCVMIHATRGPKIYLPCDNYYCLNSVISL